MKFLYATIAIVFIFSLSFFGLDIPKASITDIVSTSNSISLNYSLVDTDANIIMDTSKYYSTIEIYEGKELIKEQEISETDGEEVIFENLDPDTVYNVKINAPYDARKVGTPYNEDPYTILSKNISTNDNEVVADILNSSSSTRDSITIDYQVLNADAKLKLSSVDELVDTDLTNTYTFEDLEPDTKYVAEILVEDEVYDTMGFKTKKAIRPPTAEIFSIEEGSEATGDSLKIKYHLEDKDRVIMKQETIHPRISIYKEDQLIDIANAKKGYNYVEFKELDQGEYRVLVTAMYDLESDGTVSNQKPYILDEMNFVIE